MEPQQDDNGVWTVSPNFRRSASVKAGVNQLRQHLRETVFADLTREQMPNDAQIDDMIDPHNTMFKLRWFDGRSGDWVSLKPYITQGEEKMKAGLRTLVALTVGLENVDVQYVFLAGGAAPRVTDAVVAVFGAQRVFLPGQRPGDDKSDTYTAPRRPERLVAQGLHRYGRYRMNRRQS